MQMADFYFRHIAVRFIDEVVVLVNVFSSLAYKHTNDTMSNDKE